MKVHLTLIPNSFAELNQITQALVAGEIEIEAEKAPVTISQAPASMAALVPESAPASTAAPVGLAGLKVGTERDTSCRLWCADINTSNKGTKDDGVFKRKPKLDEAEYQRILTLLNEEARETIKSPEDAAAAGLVGNDAPTPPPTVPAAPTPTSATPPPPATTTGAATPPPPSAPTPPPPSAPTPPPVPTITKYRTDSGDFTRDQLIAAGWPEATIDALPTFEMPGAAPTAESQAQYTYSETQQRMMKLVAEEGVAIQLRDLIALGTDGAGLNENMTPDQITKLNASFDRVIANMAAFKSGELTPAQAYGA